MTDANAAKRAQEWLERQLAELGQLRNASRRDPNFKAWRQHTLTLIQRIWPGDVNRMDRFRRIPFSPPMARASERQVREYYERGWGEAGVLLRGYLAEINLLGLSATPAPDSAPAGPLELSIAPLPEAQPEGTDEDAAPPPVVEPGTADAATSAEDDISRAMERLLSSSPVFRGVAPASPQPPAPPPPEPSPPESELFRLTRELEALGLSPAHASAAREALLSLARTPQAAVPDWQLVCAALHHAATTPALARRLVPLLLEFIERAA